MGIALCLSNGICLHSDIGFMGTVVPNTSCLILHVPVAKAMVNEPWNAGVAVTGPGKAGVKRGMCFSSLTQRDTPCVWTQADGKLGWFAVWRCVTWLMKLVGEVGSYISCSESPCESGLIFITGCIENLRVMDSREVSNWMTSGIAFSGLQMDEFSPICDHLSQNTL